MVVKQYTVSVTAADNLVEQVAEATELAVPALADAAEKGAVWWQRPHGQGRWRKPIRLREFTANTGKQPNVGDQILVNYNGAALAEIPPVTSLVQAFDNYSVFNKPRGAFSQGTKWGDHCSMPLMAEVVCKKPCYLVHRLDRAASGLMLLAHTRNATTALATLFADGAVTKHYRVAVHGHYAESLPVTLNSPIDGRQATTIVHTASPAVTADRTILDVEILTGRKHQIREHLAKAGFPVVGDRLFDNEREHEEDLALSAQRLQFTCPFSKKIIDVSLP